MGKSHYLVLDVLMGASHDEIRNAYRRMARVQHPDLGGAAADFLRLNEAHEVLTDPRRRAAYDDELRQWAADRGCVLCERCTASNRMGDMPTQQRAVCGHCRADLPPAVQRVQPVAGGFLQRLGAVFGEDALTHLEQAAIAGIRHLRNRTLPGGK